MEPRHKVNPEGQKAPHAATDDDLERITNPMVVVFGYTQLLQRRLRRGEDVDREELLRVLGLMESASRSMITGIARLSEKSTPKHDDST